MTEKERMVYALKVWWVTYGMAPVSSEELLDNEVIHGGFIWDDAIREKLLTEDHFSMALTQKAIDLIKEFQHGH
jgi:hypothetical protein